MIEEKLLISYLEKQKREGDEKYMYTRAEAQLSLITNIINEIERI